MKRAVRAGSNKNITSRLVALYSTRSQGLCLQCRRRAAAAIQSGSPANPHSIATRHYASNSMRDKVLKKLWGSSAKDSPKEPNERMTAEERAEREEAEKEAGSAAEPELGEERLMDDYEPAIRGEGLPRIGGERLASRSEQLGLKSGYRGFMRATQLAPSSINSAVRRALIEVYTLKEAGQPLIVSTTLEDDRSSLPTQSARIFQDNEGKTHIRWNNEDMRGALVQALTTPYSIPAQRDLDEAESIEEEDSIRAEVVAEEQTTSQESQPSAKAQRQDPNQFPDEDLFEAETVESEQKSDEAETLSSNASQDGNIHSSSQRVPESNDTVIDQAGTTPTTLSRLRDWRGIRFNDEDTKFALLKRVMQLTGIRIRDPAIQGIQTVRTLLEQLHEKPKPKKLAEALTLNKQLQELPNVQLMARRYTPIDRHQELGRWKVIVNELKERDLPITGTLQPSEIEVLAAVTEDEGERDRLLSKLEA